mmetsp:Transcript_116541/g.249213  ORF Transcript_116541/g.249213 Transcript_116541/m.249213 type:complete len:305 (+) Transcript_116541:542-1456(+)
MMEVCLVALHRGRVDSKRLAPVPHLSVQAEAVELFTECQGMPRFGEIDEPVADVDALLQIVGEVQEVKETLVAMTHHLLQEHLLRELARDLPDHDCDHTSGPGHGIGAAHAEPAAIGRVRSSAITEVADLAIAECTTTAVTEGAAAAVLPSCLREERLGTHHQLRSGARICRHGFQKLHLHACCLGRSHEDRPIGKQLLRDRVKGLLLAGATAEVRARGCVAGKPLLLAPDSTRPRRLRVGLPTELLSAAELIGKALVIEALALPNNVEEGILHNTGRLRSARVPTRHDEVWHASLRHCTPPSV